MPEFNQSHYGRKRKIDLETAQMAFLQRRQKRSNSDQFKPDPNKIDLSVPQQVNRKGQQGEMIRKEVIPIAFGSERAKEIITHAKSSGTVGPWVDRIDSQMTDEEVAYVMAVWKAIPSGCSHFMIALFEIENGFKPN